MLNIFGCGRCWRGRWAWLDWWPSSHTCFSSVSGMSQSFFWIHDAYAAAQQCCGTQGCGSGSALSWISGSGSGSRKVKIAHTNRKVKNFHGWSARCSLLRAEGFSCSWGVLYFKFLIKKVFPFLLIKTLDLELIPDPHRICIRIHIKSIRIHNPVGTVMIYCDSGSAYDLGKFSVSFPVPDPNSI